MAARRRNAQRWLIQHILFPAKDMLLRKRPLEVLAELERTQWLSQEALRELQWAKLRRILKHAYQTVPYYQRVFRERNVRPDDITDWQAFADLVPVLTKAVVQREGRTLVSRHPGPHPRMARTSGSTGRPMLVWTDSLFSSYANASGLRGRRWWGVGIGSLELKFWGVSTPFEKSLREKARSSLRRVKDVMIGVIPVSAFDLSRPRLIAHYQTLLRRRPELIFGYGTAIYILAEFIHREGLSLQGYHPQVIIYTSEMIYPSQKQLIEDVFGAPLVSEYGCVELGVLGYECPQKRMHLSEEIAYFEIVNQNKYGDDRTGELVVTGLVNRTFPLIRYKLGDVVQTSRPGVVCACGRQLMVLDKLVGRANDLIRKPNGEYIHPELFDYLMRYQPDIRRYRIIEKGLGCLEVQLEMPGELSATQRDDLMRSLTKFVGDNMAFQIVSVPRLENDPSGKFRWVISQPGSNIPRGS